MSDDGGPAYPQEFHVDAVTGGVRDSWADGDGGMSLLDYFAGQVMAGMAANPRYCAAMASWADDDHDKGTNESAAEAYRVAAAMLAEKTRREADNG